MPSVARKYHERLVVTLGPTQAHLLVGNPFSKGPRANRRVGRGEPVKLARDALGAREPWQSVDGETGAAHGPRASCDGLDLLANEPGRKHGGRDAAGEAAIAIG